MRILALTLTCFTFLAPSAVRADAIPRVEEVIECLERNIPRATSEQSVEFVSVNRVGGKRETRAKILGKRMDDGLRRLLLRFTKPIDMRGAALLVIETGSGDNEMHLYTPEARKVKRVNAHGGSGTLFGTDFSYEDFERWQLLNKPGKQQRKADAMVSGRGVYVVESRPSAESGSSYERVVSYVDKETCVVLKSESYEPGKFLRKILKAKPDSVIEENGIHVASEVTMEDKRDETHTDVVVEDLEVDGEISDRKFQISELLKKR